MSFKSELKPVYDGLTSTRKQKSHNHNGRGMKMMRRGGGGGGGGAEDSDDGKMDDHMSMMIYQKSCKASKAMSKKC